MAATNLSFLPDQTSPTQQPHDLNRTPEPAAAAAVDASGHQRSQVALGGSSQAGPFSDQSAGSELAAIAAGGNRNRTAFAKVPSGNVGNGPAFPDGTFAHASSRSPITDAGEYETPKTQPPEGLKRPKTEQSPPPEYSLSANVLQTALTASAGEKADEKAEAAATLGQPQVSHATHGVLVHSHPHVHFIPGRYQPEGEGTDGAVAVIRPTAANGYVAAIEPAAGDGFVCAFEGGVGGGGSGGAGRPNITATVEVHESETGLAAQADAQEVETRPNRSRSMSRVEQEEFLTASTWRIAAEIAIPFLIAGLGMVCAGLLLDYFTEVRPLLCHTDTEYMYSATDLNAY